MLKNIFLSSFIFTVALTSFASDNYSCFFRSTDQSCCGTFYFSTEETVTVGDLKQLFYRELLKKNPRLELFYGKELSSGNMSLINCLFRAGNVLNDFHVVTQEQLMGINYIKFNIDKLIKVIEN